MPRSIRGIGGLRRGFPVYTTPEPHNSMRITASITTNTLVYTGQIVLYAITFGLVTGNATVTVYDEVSAVPANIKLGITQPTATAPPYTLFFGRNGITMNNGIYVVTTGSTDLLVEYGTYYTIQPTIG